jgi:hypothetical protein
VHDLQESTNNAPHSARGRGADYRCDPRRHGERVPRLIALLVVLLNLDPLRKPLAADSLAGVIARLTGVDSSLVAKIRWLRDSRPYLDQRPASDYRYQLPAGATLSPSAMVPIVANTAGLTITFATDKNGEPRSSDESVLKHEMLHAMTGRMDHPASLFQKVESYRGR